jgi:predicted nucleic acid-binding protein
MPSSADAPDALVDTSLAVALVVEDHEHHAAVVAVAEGLVLGLAGHAAFETFSVLTRLPPPARRAPTVVREMLDANFPRSRFLSAGATSALQHQLVEAGIAGGAVFDALVGAVATEHGLPLLTRDRRALETYRVLDVDAQLVADPR